jgi:ferric-dicitrate binding protein FerR (iron transport regulator)
MNTHERQRFPRVLEHEPDADELRAVWTALEEASPDHDGEVAATDAAWTALAGRLGFSGRASTGATTDAPGAEMASVTALPVSASRVAETAPREVLGAGSRSRAPWLRVAAVAVLALGSAAVWQGVPVSRTAPAGSQFAVTLPDGSEVTLNAGSSLRYRRGFAWMPGVPQARRGVTLEGEAFFDVASDGRPFEVQAGGARVTVLGTRFNVRARPAVSGEAAVRVDVEEGRVRVTAERGVAAVELGAGEAVRVEPGAETLTVEPVSASRIGAWRSGGLTVTDEPLAVVLSEIGIRFGVSVTLADTTEASTRVTAYYPLLGEISSVLADLATQQNLRVRRTADGWEIF